MAGTLDIGYLFSIPGILNLAEIVCHYNIFIVSFSFLSLLRIDWIRLIDFNPFEINKISSGFLKYSSQ